MVQDGSGMIRVGFALPEDERWTGGVNYLRNLLFALASVEERTLEPVLFVGDQIDAGILDRFRGLAQIVRSPALNRRSPVRVLRRAVARLTGHDLLFRRLLRRNRIAVASHCNVAKQGLPFRTINWIPDFQHLHLPELFPPSEIARRNRKYGQWLHESDLMLFSSEDARRDALSLAPDAADRMRVLHFVSQTNPRVYELDDCGPLCRKYSLPKKFFYLPNQFWTHKNHRVVIEALGVLKREDCEVHVVCTGLATDLKSSGFYEQLTSRIDELGVADQIHILGMIDYDDVLTLFRHCVAVINPSLFEGWSSTVEEAKSIGKMILLSDIGVHREQAPPGGRYFAPDDAGELAGLLKEEWESRAPGPDFGLESRARAALPERTRYFGETYQQLVLEVLGKGVA